MPTSVDPRDGETIATHDEHTEAEVDARIGAAFDTWHDWAATPVQQRAALQARVAEQLDARREELAELMVREMGKTITAARSEVDKCAWLARWEAEHGPDHLAPVHLATDARTSLVRFDPLGPLLAVMPWNFPLWQVVRAVVPATTAGNPVLLKHASNVTGVAKAFERLYADAGAPEGLVTTLVVSSDRIEDVIADDRVRCVTLTGSVPAGRAVAAAAGRNLKPSVMELGGSDPFIVLPDADLQRAAEVGATARLINNGQSCIAAKRFLVHADVADEFTDAFVAAVAARSVGDPMDDDTDVGPMARTDLRDELDDQVRRSLDAGAGAALRGGPREGPGAWYDPTVLVDVDPEHALGSEETFGPAAAVLSFRDDDELVALANGTEFGLGASLWTGDRDRAEALVPRIQAGCVFVNQLVKSDPRVPFGGVKDSGYGRELSSWGTRSFVNAKTVWLEDL